MRIFKNIKTGKRYKLDEEKDKEVINSLEKDKLFKELMNL